MGKLESADVEKLEVIAINFTLLKVSINFFSVSYFYNCDDSNGILDGIDHPIIIYTNSVQIILT
jgi:hypothetical protein